MPRKVRCVRCNGHVADVGRLSARKVCTSCAAARIQQACIELRERRGPIFEDYRAGLTDYVANLYRGEIPPSMPVADPVAVENETPTARETLPA